MKRYLVTLLTTLWFIYSCEEDLPLIPLSGNGPFVSKIDDAIITGELFLPEGEGPFPVLIAVPGSGNTPKEEQAAWAPMINALGYALYVYDKRGVGESTGLYPTVTTENPEPFLKARADDVTSIIIMLDGHEDIITEEIGLWASGQGTLVSTLVYRDVSDRLARLILMSGGAATTGEVNYYEQLMESEEVTIAVANERLQQFDGTVGFDPQPILEDITIPTLFIFGGQDVSHPTRYDSLLVANMEKDNFRIHWYEKANHALLEAETMMYPEELFSRVGEWLMSQ